MTKLHPEGPTGAGNSAARTMAPDPLALPVALHQADCLSRLGSMAKRHVFTFVNYRSRRSLLFGEMAAAGYLYTLPMKSPSNGILKGLFCCRCCEGRFRTRGSGDLMRKHRSGAPPAITEAPAFKNGAGDCIFICVALAWISPPSLKWGRSISCTL